MSIDHDAPAWSRRYTRAEMTTGEADAYRRAVADCVAILERHAADMRALVTVDIDSSRVVWSNAATLEMAAQVCRMLKPRGEETGLCDRGA